MRCATPSVEPARSKICRLSPSPYRQSSFISSYHDERLAHNDRVARRSGAGRQGGTGVSASCHLVAPSSTCGGKRPKAASRPIHVKRRTPFVGCAILLYPVRPTSRSSCSARGICLTTSTISYASLRNAPISGLSRCLTRSRTSSASPGAIVIRCAKKSL